MSRFAASHYANKTDDYVDKTDEHVGKTDDYVETPYCGSIGCPNGYAPIADAHDMECDNSKCEEKQCCEAFCLHYACPDSYTPVYGADTILCPDSGCDTDLCCDKGASQYRRRSRLFL